MKTAYCYKGKSLWKAAVCTSKNPLETGNTWKLNQAVKVIQPTY
jgi:hypothetical protein